MDILFLVKQSNIDHTFKKHINTDCDLNENFVEALSFCLIQLFMDQDIKGGVTMFPDYDNNNQRCRLRTEKNIFGDHAMEDYFLNPLESIYIPVDVRGSRKLILNQINPTYVQTRCY